MYVCVCVSIYIYIYIYIYKPTEPSEAIRGLRLSGSQVPGYAHTRFESGGDSAFAGWLSALGFKSST